MDPSKASIDPGQSEDLTRLLPDGWSQEGKRVLDLDREGGADSLLGAEGAGFDLIWAPATFTRLGEDWANRLAELHGLIAADGLLVAGLLSGRAYEELTGAGWDESRVGMSVFVSPEDGGSLAFHSEWWLRAHWGRAFEFVDVETDDERIWIVLRKLETSVGPEQLRQPADDPRELSAARGNVADLLTLNARLEASHRYELEAQKEALSRELVRKTYRISRSEREAERTVSEVTSSLSWRVTRPLRGARSLLSKRGGG